MNNDEENKKRWREEARVLSNLDPEITTLEHFWFEKGYLAARRQAHSEVEIFKSNCLIHEEDLNDEIQKLREQNERLNTYCRGSDEIIEKLKEQLRDLSDKN